MLGSYLISFLIFFNQGNLCLSAHTAPPPVQKTILITLAGDEIQLPIELQEFDRLSEFENAVIESLPLIGQHSTFGCELEFVSRSTQQILAGQLRQRAKAIYVPAADNDRVLPNAFSHVSNIRHVQVEVGVHTIGEAAWQRVVNDSKLLNCGTRLFVCRTVPSRGAMSSELCLFQGASNSDAVCLRNAALCLR